MVMPNVGYHETAISLSVAPCYAYDRMAYSKELLEQMAKAQDVFVWETASFERVERGPRWYIWMMVVAVALTAYAIYTQNYLFAFIILLTAIILILAANKQDPRNVLIQVGTNGVVYDGTFYQYDALSDFAIIFQPPETKILYIQPKGLVGIRLRIDLDDQDPVALRNHLKKYMDEDLNLQEEHFSDTVARLLKI